VVGCRLQTNRRSAETAIVDYPKKPTVLESSRATSGLDEMISLRNVEKFFLLGNTKQYVLRQITLDIEENEFVTVMGPSGAGKSTLLGILGMGAAGLKLRKHA